MSSWRPQCSPAVPVVVALLLGALVAPSTAYADCPGSRPRAHHRQPRRGPRGAAVPAQRGTRRARSLPRIEGERAAAPGGGRPLRGHGRGAATSAIRRAARPSSSASSTPATRAASTAGSSARTSPGARVSWRPPPVWLRGLRDALAVERDHDQLVDAERRDQVGLLLERGQELRRGRPVRPRCAGAVRRSARCRQPAMTSRWPTCTPSNSPTARRRGRGFASGSQVMSISRGSLRRA